jgi:hypothetical protein
MITREILDESWRNLRPASSQLRRRGVDMEWVVTFQNPSVSNPAHRTLYVILAPYGEYIAANFTDN